MPTLAFLLSPSREIPVRDDLWMAKIAAWIDRANFAWFDLWKALPESEQKSVPRMPPGRSLSGAAADPGFKKDPQIMESARTWAAHAWKDWHDSGRKEPIAPANSAAAHEALQIDSRMSLPELTGYAGGFTEIAAAKLKRGGRHAFLKNEGEVNAFAFGMADGTQKELFLEIARGHGGDHLAIWTFGHALHVLVARSEKPGARPRLYGPFSVRAHVNVGSKRPGGFVEAVADALAGSTLQPDFDALRRELAKPELSVEKCFLALGVPGARDFASPDVAARWEDMNCIGRALLTGQVVDKKQLKNVQELLKPLGDTKIPSKGKLGKGETARVVATAMLELRNALGVPESGIWAERFRAAAYYWDICDGEALDRLAAGVDRAGIGIGAAVVRLLAHFPEELARDSLFLALLALECEAANGHAYVEGLSKLAEETATAGLLLVAAPGAQQAGMRKTFGIDPETDGTLAGAPFCGEALISGTTISKGDVAQTARAWMAKAKATGAIAELAADGTATVAWFREGAAVKDAKETGLGSADPAALQDAAKKFLPRKAFLALGAGDLLAPGKWQPGSHSGEGSGGGAEDHKVKKRRHANAVLDNRGEPQPLKRASDLSAVLGTSLRYKGPLHENDGGIISLGFIPPAPDPVWAWELRNDLKARSLIYVYGDAWMHGAEVRGYTCSDLDVGLLSQVLGDASAGTVLVVGHGADLRGAWRIS
jgi:hypothetical protein